MSIRIDLDSAEGNAVGSVIAETKRGKKIRLHQYPFGLYWLSFADGGKMPRSLAGRFTHPEDAVRAAEHYVINMKCKKDKEIDQ